MKRLFFSSKLDARRAQRIIDKALGLPRAATPIGNGPHMPSPPGDEQYCEIRKIRNQSKWVLVCDENIRKIPMNARQWSRLTALQQTQFSSALANQEDEPETDFGQLGETVVDD